jgi:2-amino-4-hydroxy-6-hydroxymethyldihydropteridine diphosphokinase
MNITTLYLGLGSNINAKKNISFALSELKKIFNHVEVSPIYKCPAFGFDGPVFLNLVVKLSTDKSISDVLAILRKIEIGLGRAKKVKKYTNREIDIDMLLYGEYIGKIEHTWLPRADILLFPFVLKPLSDIFPEGEHPLEKKSYQLLWQEMQSGTIDVNLEQQVHFE